MANPLTLIRVIDVESTGIEDPAEMVEVGWTDIRLFPDGWAIESGPHSHVVNPGMPITFPAMAVHHFTPDDVASGMDPDEARALATNGADVLCAHNWAFDSRFIRSRLPAICTMKCAKTVWPELQSYSNGSIRYELGLIYGDQKAMPSHRAGPDTWVTAHILLKLLAERSLEDLLKISANPVHLLKMPGGNKHKGKPFDEIARVDPGYLRWIVNTSEFGEDIKFSAGKALERARERA